MKRLFKRLYILLFFAFILTACGKNDDSQNQSTSTNNIDTESIANKDELVLGFGSEPDKGWDPIHGSGHYGTSLFQSALLKRDVDLNIVPDLAKSYELSEDKKTIRIELKDDLKFSDGSDLTAKDVALHIILLKKKGLQESI